ncbi:zeta toxin family protein [Streptomyces sp. NPDC058052]|uniref:zeta toxin family protein n=1 Tax=Streptomyces sp. NPDC058052 TaxID=3346316 RepID=UPI0036ED1E57
MEKYGELLAEVIVPQLTAVAVAQENPVVVFVAGQAGSGKTLVMDLVHAALGQRGGAVRVDRDGYKDLQIGGGWPCEVDQPLICLRRQRRGVGGTAISRTGCVSPTRRASC